MSDRSESGHGHRRDHDHGGHGNGGDGDHSGHHAQMVDDFRRRFWISLVATAPVLVLSPMLQRLTGLTELSFPGQAWVQLAFASFIYVYGGWPFLTGLVKELRNRQPGMMTLIAVAISVAYGYSALVVLGLGGEVLFWELATLIVIMLAGHWIEMRSVMGASRALEELARLMPADAHRLDDDGQVTDVPVGELVGGDRVLVKPGEKVPVDGEVVEGRTSVNQAMLTGESQPVEKAAGDEVIGGSINSDGSITVEVRKVGSETYLAQVIEVVRAAQESRSRTQDLANRAARWLTMLALSAGAITFAGWLAAGQTLEYALERTVTVMVITCPHALGLAVPLVIAVSTSLAASRGLLVRDRSAFERARLLQAVVFDKTGTLTEGRFGVTDVVALGDSEESEVLRLAASLETHSEHPIATGIVEHARERELALAEPEEFEAIPGKGARAKVEGRVIAVVSPGYLTAEGLSSADDGIAALREQGKTVVYVVEGERVLGAIALADVIRKESREALDALHAMGVQTMMLTGDAEPVARWVAGELGLDDVFAEVLPDQKAAKIAEVRARGLIVAMTGDGVNDAPALVEADVGIAIGAGADVAIESADIVLVSSDPRDVVSLIGLARATYRKMVQNLWWATGYNVLAIPVAAGAFASYGIVLSPAVGAALMSLSTVIVAFNARLLRAPEGRE